MEEEYQVVDPRTWELRSTIHSLLEIDRRDGVQDFRAEFLQSQLETGTRICATAGELRSEVRRMRRAARDLAQSLGLAVVAAGTHPFSAWSQQQVTQGERYIALADELQVVGRRLVTCGLHVHIGIADPDQRIQVMNRLRPFLPLLLALSTSSPFFEHWRTGLHSYRTVLFSALPRTGIPPYFASWADYQAAVEMLTGAGLVADPSFLWWDARPNPRVPTLEVRIPDMPTRIEETVCLAAWTQALVVKLAQESEPPPLRRFAVEVSKWQAARYGLRARLLLFAGRSPQSVAEWVDELLDWLGDVAERLGSQVELAYARVILREGTSADRQLRVWEEEQDLRAVVAHLARETLGEG